MSYDSNSVQNDQTVSGEGYAPPHYPPPQYQQPQYPPPFQTYHAPPPANPNTKGRHVWRAIYPVLVFLGIQVVCGVLLGILFILTDSPSPLFDPFDSFDFMWEAIIFVAIAQAMALPLFILFWRMDIKRKKEGGTYHRYERITFGKAAVCLGIGVFAALSIWCLFVLMGDEAIVFQEEFYSSNPLLAIVIIGILTPCAEELCFRVLLYGRLREWMSPISAGLLSSLVFCIAHGNAEQGVTAFFYGFALALVYERWKSALAPILVHAGINSTVVLLASIPGIGINAVFGIPIPVVEVIAVLLLGVGIFLAIKLPAAKEKCDQDDVVLNV